MVPTHPTSTLFPYTTLFRSLGSEEETRVFVTTRIPLVDDQQLINELRAHNVEFAGRIETTFWKDLLINWVIPLAVMVAIWMRSEEHTSELQSHSDLVCRLLL